MLIIQVSLGQPQEGNTTCIKKNFKILPQKAKCPLECLYERALLLTLLLNAENGYGRINLLLNQMLQICH